MPKPDAPRNDFRTLAAEAFPERYGGGSAASSVRVTRSPANQVWPYSTGVPLASTLTLTDRRIGAPSGRRGLGGQPGAGAGVIGNAHGSERPRHRTGFGQCRRQGRKPRRRKHRAKRGNGQAVDQRDALEHMHRRVAFKAQRRGLARLGAAGLDQQHLPRGHPPRSGDVLVKPHPPPQRVIGGARRDEDPSAAAGINQPLGGQPPHGGAQGVAIDAKARGKLRLGGQPLARKIARHRFRAAGPQRDRR